MVPPGGWSLVDNKRNTHSAHRTQTLIALKPMGKGRGQRAQKAPLKEIAAHEREIAAATGPQRAMPPARKFGPRKFGADSVTKFHRA
jgi:hypothetical protein